MTRRLGFPLIFSLALLAVLVWSDHADAQDWLFGHGVMLGDPAGLTAKSFFSPADTLDVDKSAFLTDEKFLDGNGRTVQGERSVGR
ncbi:MAG: hypothetical protein M5R36_04160 [Deltaproteobacteria bacterium]|nr:hypothetical protein [Deltaproteobacteria bacterium]